MFCKLHFISHPQCDGCYPQACGFDSGGDADGSLSSAVVNRNVPVAIWNVANKKNAFLKLYSRRFKTLFFYDQEF
jgi:hypothetical protein